MQRQTISTGTPWETQVGYSRAVKVGPFIQVAGTTATDESGAMVAHGDPYGQTVQIIRKIEAALCELGADLSHVVRTRIFVTSIDHWQAVAQAHGEFFCAVRPASTMVEVSRLIDPHMLVEIEADAIVLEDAT